MAADRALALKLQAVEVEEARVRNGTSQALGAGRGGATKPGGQQGGAGRGRGGRAQGGGGQGQGRGQGTLDAFLKPKQL